MCSRKAGVSAKPSFAAPCEAIEKADGQVVRSRVDFGGEGLLAARENCIGEGAADVDVNYPHGFLLRCENLRPKSKFKRAGPAKFERDANCAQDAPRGSG